MQPSQWFKPAERIFCTDATGTLKVHPAAVTCDVCRNRASAVIIPMAAARSAMSAPALTPHLKLAAAI